LRNSNDFSVYQLLYYTVGCKKERKETEMDIKKAAFWGYPNSYECHIGDKKLVIMTDFGPRILHLSIGDRGNMLFLDEGTPLKKDAWNCYGGSRLWIAPETIQTYSPDNEKCEVNLEKDRITVSSEDKALKLRRSMTVFESHGHFAVEIKVVNTGDSLYSGALWSLTCMDPAGTAFFPWGTGTDSWNTKKIIYWQKWIDHSSQLGSKQYTQGNDLFIIRPTGEEGKVGTSGHEGFIGFTSKKGTFIKKINRLATNDYPDDNCAIECYKIGRASCRERVLTSV
jgi:hypothetical protein